eukprot:3160920-Rhodomonas_salina.1
MCGEVYGNRGPRVTERVRGESRRRPRGAEGQQRRNTRSPNVGHHKHNAHRVPGSRIHGSRIQGCTIVQWRRAEDLEL